MGGGCQIKRSGWENNLPVIILDLWVEFRILYTFRITYNMSSSKRRNEIKQLRNSYTTKTLKELEDKGFVPKNFHLSDRVDMKEYQIKHKTDWWNKMSTTYGGGGNSL